MKSKTRWIFVSLVLTSLAAVTVQADTLRAPEAALGIAALAPLGTGFTYQGKLEDGSGPVTDDCDMEFRLYSHATDPSQVGSTITDTVSVSDGLFTVELDFGASAFDGNARWLGIQVQCTGDPGFTDLGRQELTPTPYALYALKAPWSGLTGVPAGFADGVDNNTTYSPGTGLSLAGTTFSANTTYLQRRVSGTCGAGNAIRVINADGTVTCEAVGGSGPHDHWGETWTGSGTGLNLYGGAIGVAGSGSDYGVFGGSSSGYGVYGQSGSNFSGAGVYGTAPTTGTVGIATATSGIRYGVYGRANSTGGYGVYGTNPSGVGVGGNGFYHGIYGSSSNGNGVYGESTSDNHVGVYGFNINGTGVSGYGATGVWGASNTSGPGVVGTATTTGTIGIATATSGTTYGVYGRANSNSGYGVYGSGGTGVYGHSNSASGYGVYGSNYSGTGVYGLGSTYGVYGYNDYGGSGVHGFSEFSGSGVYGESSSGTGVRGSSSSGTAISAEGTGVIRSTADSVLYLSPHDMVIRQDNPGLLSVTPQPGGSVRVRNESGTGTRYLSIPVPAFGQLFGAQVYVKSLEVCFNTSVSVMGISATTVSKNDGTGIAAHYIYDVTPRSSTVYTCYTLDAPTPRVPIDNSTWVQFNMTFSGSGSASDIYIYTVELTLTEEQW